MGTPEAHGEGAAGQHKVVRQDQETIKTLSVISRIGPSKKDSWDQASGIESSLLLVYFLGVGTLAPIYIYNPSELAPFRNRELY